MNKKISLTQFGKELERIIDEYEVESFEARQKAVQAGAEVFKAAMEAATPKETGEMARSWEIKPDYPNHRYVGNTRTAKGVVHRKGKNGTKGQAREGVPLTNVLEYAENSPHQGFMRRTFDSTEPQIYEAIKKTIKNGG